MPKYVEKAKEMITQLNHFEVQAIPIDGLSKLASSDSLNIERSVMVEVLKEISITEKL